ncbi:hypothetical protein T484DRAFT_1788349 [Baffinella frigidus]|nr:hypothetical protein T484DRAFT_1788349 [Cryptophyta sp. CCMP2293]
MEEDAGEAAFPVARNHSSVSVGDTSYRKGNSLFLHCSKCKVRRPIFGDARARYDAMTQAGQKELAQSIFTCAWVENATFENACDVPSVFAHGYDWWYDTNEGKHLFEEMGGKVVGQTRQGGKVVDHTRLFFFVQACDSELNECEEAAIARKLGFSGQRSGKLLRDVYGKMFQTSKTTGGGFFETELRGRFDAKIAETRADIRKQMSVTLSEALQMVRGNDKKLGGRSVRSVQATDAQPQRVRLYEEPSVLPVRAEKLLEQIKKVHEAACKLGDENVDVGPIHLRTRDIFRQLAEVTRFSTTAESTARRTLPFIADTGTVSPTHEA